jgi:hypothetical protein
MPVTFNNAFFEELSVSEPVTALVVEAADRVAEIARNALPRITGDYANGIGVAVKHQKRSVALVVASDPKSLIIESKTGNLARALKAAHKRG